MEHSRRAVYSTVESWVVTAAVSYSYSVLKVHIVHAAIVQQINIGR